MIEAGTQIKFYPDQERRQIKDQSAARVREATNLLRRTVRQAVGVRNPTQKKIAETTTRKRLQYQGASAPGGPPYKVSGMLQSNVGYDFRTGTAGDGTVYVDSYGMEAGTGEFNQATRRPHLQPTYEANRVLIGRIMAGETTAPRYGAFRQPSLQPPKSKRGLRRRWINKASPRPVKVKSGYAEFKKAGSVARSSPSDGRRASFSQFTGHRGLRQDNYVRTKPKVASTRVGVSVDIRKSHH